MQILTHLKKPVYALTGLGVALILFDINYYVMSTFPGERNFACVIGAALTPKNIAFAAVTSILTGILVGGLLALYSFRSVQPRPLSGRVSSLGGFGAILGVFTVFCTLCTLPVISLFGLSIGLGFLTDFAGIFQIASLLVLIAALFLLNRQLKGVCDVCKI